MGNLFSEEEKKLLPLIEQGKAYVSRHNMYQENTTYIFKYRDVYYFFDDGGRWNPEFEVIGSELDHEWRRTMIAHALEGSINSFDMESLVDEMIKNAKDGKKRENVFYMSDDEIYLYKEWDNEWDRCKFGDDYVMQYLYECPDEADYVDLTNEEWEILRGLECTHPKIKNFGHNVPLEIDIDKLEKEIRIKFFEGEIPDWEDNYCFFSDDLVIVNGVEFEIDEVREKILELAKKTDYKIPYREIEKKEWKRLKKMGHSRKDIAW